MTRSSTAGQVVAEDAERMRGIFERHVRSLGGSDFTVDACTIVGVRRRQGRTWLQYRLALRDAARDHVVDLLVSGVIGARERSLRSVSAESAGPAALVAADEPLPLPPFSFLDELGMVVQVFPHDLRLPALATLMGGSSEPIASHLLTQFGPGVWEVTAWTPELVRYRIEMQATVRIAIQATDVASGRTASRRFYAKTYHRPNAGRRSFHLLRDLDDRAAGGFTVGRPVAYLGDAEVLLQEEVPGISLRDRLTADDDVPAALRATARAVARLHQLRFDAGEPVQRRDRLAALAAAAARLRSSRPELTAAVEGTVRDVVRCLETGPSAPTHGDLKPEHILLDGDRVGMIDFDLFTTADPLFDVAYVLFQLRRDGERLYRRSDRWRSWQRIFADEYFAHVPDAWAAGLPAHYAAITLIEAATTWRGQRQTQRGAGRGDLVATMIEDAATLMIDGLLTHR